MNECVQNKEEERKKERNDSASVMLYVLFQFSNKLQTVRAGTYVDY